MQYKEQIIIEIGGHDHWQDVRYYKNKQGEIYRNLLIAAAISPDHGQMPGFNTFKVEDQVVKDLVETNIDITKTYGLFAPPPLEDIPTYSYDFSKILPDLSVESIDKFYEESSLDDFLQLISNKLGYKTSDPDMYKDGLDLAASWGLISPTHDNANFFICQNTKARSQKKIQECFEQLSKKFIQ